MTRRAFLRAWLHAAALGLVFFGTVANGRAQTAEAELLPVVYEAADHYGINRAWLERILRCESGNFRTDIAYGPTRGAAGEMGVAQIHPRGLGPLFASVGYTDPFDPSQAIWFTSWALSRGMASHWTCQ